MEKRVFKSNEIVDLSKGKWMLRELTSDGEGTFIRISGCRFVQILKHLRRLYRDNIAEYQHAIFRMEARFQ